MYDPIEAVCIAFHQKWQRWSDVFGEEHSGRGWHEMPASYRRLVKQVVRHMVEEGDICLNHWNG